MLFSQLHDLEARINVRQLYHGRIIEKEILSMTTIVALIFKPFAMDVEDLHSHASGTRLFVIL